jgi:Holliday junction DNA helicase RuvA
MIDFVRGVLVHMTEDAIIIDVNGLGYRVFCPNPYAFQKEIQEIVTVYTHHHVREDAILLYGFTTREEQSLFRRLLDVSGIGPKGALGILSGSRPDQLIAAIQQENLAVLTKLPGIGKKTAQRMILDLKDKLGDMRSGIGGVTQNLTSYNTLVPSGAMEEAKEALVSLGYGTGEADRVLSIISKDIDENTSVDKVIKLALKQFLKG